jgi:hypothetical protein
MLSFMITIIRKVRMNWEIEFYNESVEEAILAMPPMPPKLQARMLKLLELIENIGLILALRIQSLWGMGYLKSELRLKRV